MRVTVRADLTWDGVSKEFNNNSDKGLRKVLKEMTGASEVDIINRNSWDEEEYEYDE